MPNADDVMRCRAWPIDDDGEPLGNARTVELRASEGTIWAREVSDPVVVDDLVDATRYGIGQILSPTGFTYHVDPAGETEGWLGTVTRALSQTVRDTTGQDDLEVVVDFSPLMAPIRRLSGIVGDVVDLVRRLEASDSPIGRELLEAGEAHRRALETALDLEARAMLDPVIIDDPVSSGATRPTAEVLEDMQAWMDTYQRATGWPATVYRRPGAALAVGEVIEDESGIRFTGEAIVASGGFCAPLVDYEMPAPWWHPSQSPVDQLDYDGCPEGCWATAIGDEHDADAEACNGAVVDALGLCAEHRARMVDQD